jgi:hypothetical protein
MDATRKAIEDRMTPLEDFMAQLGEDMAQSLIDALNKKKNELITLANSIGEAIASAMASAMAGLGVNPNLIQTPPALPPVTPPPVPPSTSPNSSYADRDRAYDTNIIVNNNNYNPVGALENGTLTARALERVIYKRRALE